MAAMIKEESLPVKRFFTLVLLGGLILVLDLLGWLRPLKSVVEVPFGPAREVVYALRQKSAGLVGALKFIKTGKQRIADLERQVAELTVEVEHRDRLESENEALRELAGVEELEGLKLKLGRVVGAGDTIKVAIDGVEGIKERMLVVTEAGAVVGRVERVSQFLVEVLSVDHPRFEMTAETEAGVLGKVMGVAGGGAVFTDVLQGEVLTEGTRLVSVGGETWPYGLVLGTVGEIKQIPAEVYKSAKIKLLYDLSNIDYVFIVIK